MKWKYQESEHELIWLAVLKDFKFHWNFSAMNEVEVEETKI